MDRERHTGGIYLVLIFLIVLCPFFISSIRAQTLTLVELNCENLFDIRHDSLKQDQEFTPDGRRHWTTPRYWRKVNSIGQEILSCADNIPDLVALVEVENDSVLHALTNRSLLRNAGYRYLMTCSPDVRGLDVALLYRPQSFQPLSHESITVPCAEGQRPTRDILYIKGVTVDADTLHLFVVHAPSRYGGTRLTSPRRLQVATLITDYISRLDPQAKVIVAGDFNDYADSPSLQHLRQHGLNNISASARGGNGARGTYRFHGEWRSIDHILVTSSLAARVDTVYINDAAFLLDEDEKYGGKHPRRTFQNNHYQSSGFSDHLPLVVKWKRR